jgi:hypothetical protein
MPAARDDKKFLELFAAADALFGVHVLEFAGFEDFSAVLAFHEFGIFIAADDLHAQMLTGLLPG